MTDFDPDSINKLQTDLASIRQTIDKHYNPSMSQRFWQGLVRGIGFSIGSLLVVALILFFLVFLIRQIELFPGVREHITSTLSAVHALWPSRN